MKKLVPLFLAMTIALTATTAMASPAEAARRRRAPAIHMIEGLPAAQWQWRAFTDKCRVQLEVHGNRHGLQHCLADRYWAGNAREHACLDVRQNRENGARDPHLKNRAGSPAYGAPQALPGSKMITHGLDWRDSLIVQFTWMMDYIRGKYGSPCGTLRRASY